MSWIYTAIALGAAYLLLSLLATYMVHQFPRRPVEVSPDWGCVQDTRIPTATDGFLEVWRVEPAGQSRGVVVLAHGWSRNRGRMVARARLFGKIGFTTVMHSARDHGNSSPHRLMNAFRFAEDIETVINWIDEPVLLYGHSVGAAGAIIAAYRNQKRIKLLFLEGCYARTREALLCLYRNFNVFFGIFLAPLVLFWMNLVYQGKLDSISPARLTSGITQPVLLIHGEKDQSFPLRFAKQLQGSFPDGQAELFIAKGSDHSSSSLDPGYPQAVRSFVKRHLPPNTNPPRAAE